MRARVFTALALAASLTPLVACGSSTLVDPAPTPASTTETFNGTVAVAGSDFHNFTIAAQGEVDITLTAAGPPATIQMGLAIGIPTTTGCTFLTGGVALAAASTSAQLAGTVAAGSYCVEVYDTLTQGQAAPVTYTVTVKHT